MTIAAVPMRFWGLFILLLIYSAALSYLGFYLSSALFLPLAMLLLGAKSPISITLTSAGVLIFVYLVFAKLLEVPLPEGALF
jgi:putative tricarboxylic transport membrane protein